MAEEGSGTSNGVNYAYSLSTNSWCGSYECRVHRVFLDTPGMEIKTKHFKAAGHTWQLMLRQEEDGNLGAYLCPQNESKVDVHFSVTLVNQNETNNESWGELWPFEPDKGFGYPKVLSIASIKDPSRGFLFMDNFIVKVVLRVKSAWNEYYTVSTDEISGTYVWNLKRPCEISPWVIVSDEFNIGELKWSLVFYPCGRKYGTNHTSFFVRSYNHSSVQAEVTLIAVNDADPAANIICNDEYTFDGFEVGYGRNDFIEAGALEDEECGFLMDGWITLIAYMTILGPQQNTAIQQVVSQMENLTIEEEPKCIFCMDKPQTSGVLHGDTTHKCYCLDCAEFLKSNLRDLHCPVCGEKVERIIQKFF